MPNPFSSSITTTFSVSNNVIIDALITSFHDTAGYGKWGGSRGTGVTISYSFPTVWTSQFWDSTYYSSEPFIGAYSLSLSEQAYARSALAQWQAVANITFVETVETSQNVGDIRIAYSESVAIEPGIWGWAYYPSSLFPEAGDIWINPSYRDDPDWGPGTYNYYALLHEIGHAIGLKHPGDYNAGGGGTDGPYLPTNLDNSQYTIMSYYDYRNWDSVTNQYIQPETPMVLDIQAIQYIYGANNNYNALSTTYQFDLARPFYKTIWDAGGVDTIDISNFSRGSVINLNPGSYSSIRYRADNSNTSYYTGENNLGIAYGTLLENVIGGSGADRITGNNQSNLINAGNGNDTIVASLANDTIYGDAGTDVLIMDCLLSQCTAEISGNGYLLISPFGRDTIFSIESIQFRNATVSPFALLPGDNTPPTISISSNLSQLKIGQSATVIFTLSEQSNDFSISDINVQGGLLSSFTSVNTRTYSAVFTPFINSTSLAYINVAAGKFSDQAGNFNQQASNTLQIRVDTLAPVVTISSDISSVNLSESATIYFSLSEPSSDFGLNDISVIGGQINNFSSINNVYYSAEFIANDDFEGQASINVSAGNFTDSAGNFNQQASNQLILNVDTQEPTINITAEKYLLKADQSEVLINFFVSEPTNNFELSDIQIEGGSLSNFTVNDQIYSALLTLNSESLSAQLIVNRESISDFAGNPNLSDSNQLIILRDITPPSLLESNALFPAPDATKVLIDTNITLQFTELITLGSGEILLKNLSNEILQSIPVTEEHINIEEYQATLSLTQPLQNGTTYRIEFSSENFLDIAGNQWTNVPSLEFTTNYLPSSSNLVKTISEDTQLIFTEQDFNFFDIDEVDNLQGVKIKSLPDTGRLLLDNQEVLLNDLITTDQIKQSEFVFIPDENAYAIDYAEFEFQVFDGSDFSEQSNTISINVDPVDDAPVFLGSSSINIIEANNFAFNLNDYFTDVDGDQIKYQVSMLNKSKLPIWLKFDNKQARLYGEPGDKDTGNFTLQVNFSDASKTTITQLLDFNIENINQSPEAKRPSLGTLNLSEGMKFNYVLPKNFFIDPDNDELLISVSSQNDSALPNWINFNPLTNTLYGRLGFSAADTSQLNVNFTATDSVGLSISSLLTINVNNVRNINGNNKANLIQAGNGDDIIRAGLGADIVNGGIGNDSINLGKDNQQDIVEFGSGMGVDNVTNFSAQIDKIKFIDFIQRDATDDILSLGAGRVGDNSVLDDANTELLFISQASLDMQSSQNIASLIDSAFDLSTLNAGEVIFAIQISEGALANKTLIGYFNHIEQVDFATDQSIELLGVINQNINTSSFWLATD